jgi:hypothetical protein
MNKRYLLGGVALAVCLVPVGVYAADHGDFMGASSDPTSDITDLWAWTSEDASRVRLILGVGPGATREMDFPTSTQYVFHVTNGPGFGAPGASRQILCQFAEVGFLECWVRGPDGAVLDYVGGDASDPAGLVSDSGAVRVFAGARSDAFFFNSLGFNLTRDAVLAAAGGLTFDDAGCPTLDMATSTTLVGQLSTGADGAAATNGFTGNILALVLEVDSSLLTRPGNQTLSIWASTRRSPE